MEETHLVRHPTLFLLFFLSQLLSLIALFLFLLLDLHLIFNCGGATGAPSVLSVSSISIMFPVETRLADLAQSRRVHPYCAAHKIILQCPTWWQLDIIETDGKIRKMLKTLCVIPGGKNSFCSGRNKRTMSMASTWRWMSRFNELGKRARQIHRRTGVTSHGRSAGYMPVLHFANINWSFSFSVHLEMWESLMVMSSSILQMSPSGFRVNRLVDGNAFCSSFTYKL